MLVYILTFLIASLSATCAQSSYTKSKILFLFFSIVTILVPSLIAGLRSDTVGTDMNYYLLEIYDNAATYSDKSQILTDPIYEPVFLMIIFCGLNIFKSLWGILFLLEFVNMTLVYSALFLLKKKLNIGVAIAIYLFLFFNDSLNLMRQHIAVSFCFFSFACLYRKKYAGSGIAYAIALFAHSTSFIFVLPLAVFELFRRGILKINSSIMKLYWIGLPLSLLLVDFFLTTLISIGVVSDKYMRYLTSENESGTRFPSSFFFFFIVFFVFGVYVLNKIPRTWNLLNLKNIIKEKDSVSFVRDFFIFDIYSVVVVGLATLVSLWIYRMNIYFQVMLVGLFPIVFKRLKPQDLKLGQSIFFILLFFYWLWTFIHSNNGETYPYHSEILGI